MKPPDDLHFADSLLIGMHWLINLLGFLLIFGVFMGELILSFYFMDQQLDKTGK